MKKGEWESSGTIIIPQRGETELTLNCIEGLRRFDTRDWRIIVVSDGCPEDERIRLNREFEHDSLVTVLNRSHAGVTASWNAGIECAESEFLVLLNNDTVWALGYGMVQCMRVRRVRLLPITKARPTGLASWRF